jgi:hypothetical protein
MVLAPTFRFIAPLALPLVTFAPLTVIDAFVADVDDVTVTEVTLFATFTEYCVISGLNAGVSAPDES